MLIVLALAGAYGAWRSARAVLASLRQLPRRNEDMVFW
jgi:hypothetical protein